MKLTEKNRVQPLWLLILILGVGSCIWEDDSECIWGLYIYFRPENQEHNYQELVQKVNLYFYDEAGYLAESYIYNKDELYSEDRAAYVENLPPGRYTLVSVINHVESYRTIQEQELETLQSHLRDKVIENPLVDFFSGICEVTVDGNPSQQKVITDIFKHNNDILVKIVSDGYEVPSGAIFNTYIEGNNGAYHYHSGTCPLDNVIKYLPYYTEMNENSIPITQEFTIMRLWRNADLTLHLQEEIPFQGVTRTIRLNIADELAEVVNDQNEYLYDTDEKLSYTDTYEIVIKLGPEFVVLELTINDWTVIGGGVDV